ncbi:hypothetical protein [Chitinophaga sp. CB10]|uniref:hypothetical protein n=1 Tax=Chitinophaga sp. CB10 TaxID=1891659 RepID=UPI0025BE5A1F|nr:hypothetical protein [Chitinophaga sp. CB10]
MDLDGGEELVKTNWINAAGKVYKTVLEYNPTAQPLQGNAIHKVDNYMDKNGYNYYTQSGIGQLDGTNFRNAIGGYNNSNNNYDFSVVKHDNPFMQWSGPGLMAEFITGTGPENTLVFSGKMIYDIQRMSSFKEMRLNGMLAINADGVIQPGEIYKDWHHMSYSEGAREIWLPALFSQKKNPYNPMYSTQHFLGSYNMTMQVLDDAETILFTVYGSKSFESMTDHQNKGNSSN